MMYHLNTIFKLNLGNKYCKNLVLIWFIKMRSYLNLFIQSFNLSNNNITDVVTFVANRYTSQRNLSDCFITCYKRRLFSICQ